MSWLTFILMYLFLRTTLKNIFVQLHLALVVWLFFLPRLRNWCLDSSIRFFVISCLSGIETISLNHCWKFSYFKFTYFFCISRTLRPCRYTGSLTFIFVFDLLFRIRRFQLWLYASQKLRGFSLELLLILSQWVHWLQLQLLLPFGTCSAFCFFLAADNLMTSQDFSTVHIVSKPPILLCLFKTLPALLLVVCNKGICFAYYLAEVWPLRTFRLFLWVLISWSSSQKNIFILKFNMSIFSWTAFAVTFKIRKDSRWLTSNTLQRMSTIFKPNIIINVSSLSPTFSSLVFESDCLVTSWCSWCSISRVDFSYLL